MSGSLRKVPGGGGGIGVVVQTSFQKPGLVSFLTLFWYQRSVRQRCLNASTNKIVTLTDTLTSGKRNGL